MPNDRELLDYGGATDAELEAIRALWRDDPGRADERAIARKVQMREAQKRLLEKRRAANASDRK